MYGLYVQDSGVFIPSPVYSFLTLEHIQENCNMNRSVDVVIPCRFTHVLWLRFQDLRKKVFFYGYDGDGIWNQQFWWLVAETLYKKKKNEILRNVLMLFHVSPFPS